MQRPSRFPGTMDAGPVARQERERNGDERGRDHQLAHLAVGPPAGASHRHARPVEPAGRAAVGRTAAGGPAAGWPERPG